MSPPVSPQVDSHRRRLLLPLAVLALALTGLATFSAYTMVGKRFPSLLLDAYGCYSIVGLPSWDPPDSPLRPHHRLISINGRALRAGAPPGAFPELNEATRGSHAQERVKLEFEGDGHYTVERRLRNHGVEEVLFFFVTYVLAAWVVLWFGGVVFAVGGNRTAKRAYTAWSIATFLFLISFYDYHTNGHLAPLFSASTLGIPLGALWLAYAFPEPPRWRTVPLQRLLIALSLLGAVAALALGVSLFTGWDLRPLRSTIDYLLPASVVILALVILLRLRRSTGLDRTELITASWGLVATPLLVVLVHLLTLATGRDVRHLVLPFIVLLFPLSIGYAMLRNNILRAQVVFTARMLLVPFALGALFLSVLGAYMAYLVMGTAVEIKVPILVGGLLLVFAIVLGRLLYERLFFHATVAFRSTVEELRDQLAVLRDIPSIRKAVEDMVTRTLRVVSARVMAPEAALTATAIPVPDDARERLAQGEHVWTLQPAREQHLLISMRSQGELRAVLLVGPKPDAALFTQEELHLLDTIASLGALALHNAEAVQQLESFRRLEVGATQDQLRHMLSALGTEVSHEMVYPLNFLRDLLRRGTLGRALDEEDLSFARDEISRMERMIQSMRVLEPPAPQVTPLPLLASTQRALLLLRESIQEKELSVFEEIVADMTVLAEEDFLLQLLANLLRNAIQAAPRQGRIGIHSSYENGRQLIEVWDTGPGIPKEVADVLFTRRITTKKQGYGIGLSVVNRIALRYRWQITFRRESDRTIFRITLPQTT